MNILLTNDDGIEAPGLLAVLEALPRYAKAVMVAPASEKSASSHSITLGGQLRVEARERGGVRQYAVHGTPADCVKFALSELKDFVPDLIVSGFNQGSNTGVSVYYSGTISAAREGLINRIPSMAISLCSKTFREYAVCQDVTRRFIQGYAQSAFPRDAMLNINVPPVSLREVRGIKITKQASSRFIEEFVPKTIHGNVHIYTLAGEIEVCDPDGTSDEEAVAANYISVTPLKLDLTDYQSMAVLDRWVKKSGENR